MGRHHRAEPAEVDMFTPPATRPKREPIAVALFRLAHHYRTGKPHISDRSLADAVAAAVLADLTADQYLTVCPVGLALTRTSQPRDPYLRAVCTAVAREWHVPAADRRLDVISWIRYLSAGGPDLPAAGDAVGDYLVDADEMVRTTRWGGKPRYRATSWINTERVGSMLTETARGRLDWTPHSAALAALAAATGLLPVVLADPGITARIDEAVERLPAALRRVLVDSVTVFGRAVTAGT